MQRWNPFENVLNVRNFGKLERTNAVLLGR
jgi:hypothetical protein